ncbi:ABC transporter ATP-binding protein [Clostridia bacterium OttesenSCG-928-O13]|nr:ABC transporter ATP-binding protein [Clostridia bacterium OttesenSCG-928-O13]
MANPVLEMRGITKRFPGVIANDKVDLTLYPGEIHALLGENGAGKSTLMNVLTAIYAADEGSIRYQGNHARLRSPKDAIQLGIGMVHQHFKLVETLTVAENIFLAAGARCKFMLNRKSMEQQIDEYARLYNLPVDPAAKIWQLSVGEQQRVEIVKALFCNANLLILDEPTAVLTPQETEKLFETLRAMADDGKAILFITHKLYEVMMYVDRITVLRGGKSVGTTLKQDTTQDELVHMMVGRDIAPMPAQRTPWDRQRPVLEMDKVTARGDKGVNALNKLSLTVHAGEILGVAGVAGNGQRELTQVITGLRRPVAGTIRVAGQDIGRLSVKDLAKTGVAYIPEDRMGTGLVMSMNMPENVILRQYEAREYNHNGLLQRREILQKTQALAQQHSIRNAGLQMPVALMSGGNQQKLLVARETNGNPKLIVAAYPVHGVDIGATEAIHKLLLEQRSQGAAILLISEDLEELHEMADRVAVLYEGGVMDIVDIADFSYDDIGRLMMGLRGEAGA